MAIEGLTLKERSVWKNHLILACFKMVGFRFYSTYTSMVAKTVFSFSKFDGSSFAINYWS